MSKTSRVVLGCFVLFSCAMAIAEEAGETKDALPAEWLATVSEDIQSREYHFSTHEDGSWTAPNRAQSLRSRISPSGVEVGSLTQRDAGFNLGLHLVSYGREGALVAMSPAQPVAWDQG